MVFACSDQPVDINDVLGVCFGRVYARSFRTLCGNNADCRLVWTWNSFCDTGLIGLVTKMVFACSEEPVDFSNLLGVCVGRVHVHFFLYMVWKQCRLQACLELELSFCDINNLKDVISIFRSACRSQRVLCLRWSGVRPSF